MRTPTWTVGYYRRNGQFRVFESCASVQYATEVAHMLLALRPLGIQHIVITKMV